MYIPIYTVCTCTDNVNTSLKHAYVQRDVTSPAEQRDVTSPVVEDGDGGSPCPEDADFMDARPDAAEMEEAIGKFVNGLEQQERSGYHELHSLLSRLPVPVANSGKTMSHAAALEGGFLPKMTEEELKRFTPTELLLWRHAKEYRYRQCPYTV